MFLLSEDRNTRCSSCQFVWFRGSLRSVRKTKTIQEATRNSTKQCRQDYRIYRIQKTLDMSLLEERSESGSATGYKHVPPSEEKQRISSFGGEANSLPVLRRSRKSGAEKLPLLPRRNPSFQLFRPIQYHNCTWRVAGFGAVLRHHKALPVG